MGSHVKSSSYEEEKLGVCEDGFARTDDLI